MEIYLHSPPMQVYVLKTENTENAWGGKGNVTGFGGKRLHVRCKGEDVLERGRDALTGSPRQGSPKWRTMASTSGFRKVRRRGL